MMHLKTPLKVVILMVFTNIFLFPIQFTGWLLFL